MKDDPNDYPCDLCGAMIHSESCHCPGCNVNLCSSCELNDECTEMQVIRSMDNFIPKLITIIITLIIIWSWVGIEKLLEKH